MLRPRPALMTADVIHPSPEPREEPQGSRYSALLQGKGFNIHFLALHKPERGVSPRLQRARRDCQPRALAKVRKEPGSAEGKAPSFQNRKRRRVGGCSLFVLPGAFLLRPQTPETFSSQEAAAPRPRARLHEELGLRGTHPNGGDAPKLKKLEIKKGESAPRPRPGSWATSKTQPKICRRSEATRRDLGRARRGSDHQPRQGPTKTNQRKMFGVAPAVYW